MLLALADGVQLLGVMLVSQKPHTDSTVVLVPGDHEFILHPTSVDYGTARPLVVSKLNGWIANGRATLQAPMDAHVLRRIQDGLCLSTRTPNDVKQLMGCP